MINTFLKQQNKMVKNTIGGNKHKGQARKFVNAKPSTKLRLSEDEDEKYACVTQMLGNGMCYVTTLNSQKFLCMIRGKFRGRSKKDNCLKNGSWVLVGLRDWETQKEGDAKTINKCDLLEVYADTDKEKLKNSVQANWKTFSEYDQSTHRDSTGTMDDIVFSNEDQEDYKRLMEAQIEKENATGKKNTLQIIEENNDDKDDEINIDDI